MGSVVQCFTRLSTHRPSSAFGLLKPCLNSENGMNANNPRLSFSLPTTTIPGLTLLALIGGSALAANGPSPTWARSARPAMRSTKAAPTTSTTPARWLTGQPRHTLIPSVLASCRAMAGTLLVEIARHPAAEGTMIRPLPGIATVTLQATSRTAGNDLVHHLSRSDGGCRDRSHIPSGRSRERAEAVTAR
jgi:hypothetical protein